MFSKLKIAALPAIMCLAATAVVYADDRAAPGPAAPQSSTSGEDHMMMDHSPADGKSMNKMKDKGVPIHHAGDEPKADAGSPGEDHMMMGHSPADGKGMSKMKDKKSSIHHSGQKPKTAAPDTQGEDHMMMDHSQADGKSMSKMKDKTVPIHHSEAAPATAPDATPKP